MHWKVKALIQGLTGALPSAISYPAYYAMQRSVGGLRRVNPLDHLRGGVGIAQRISDQRRPVEARTFLEIGTGRHVSLPVALWLCGASRIVTVDLNPYLKPTLVFETLDYIREHQEEVLRLFDEAPRSPHFSERFAQLVAAPADLPALLRTLSIEYMAPVDAARLDLASASIDYHISFTVLEHIPPDALQSILIEGARLLRPEGLFVHYIDFSDHFSHADASLSAVNFLRFTDREWRSLAGNRYAYHNRLRVDEFLALVERAGLDVLSLQAAVDPRSLTALEAGLPLDSRFKSKTAETNATVDAWMVAAAQPLQTRTPSADCRDDGIARGR